MTAQNCKSWAVIDRPYSWLFPLFAKQLKVRSLHMPFAGRAHDVVKHRSQLHDFEPCLTEIAIAADIPVTKTENVSEFMCERACGEITWCERNVSAHQAVSGLGAARKNSAVLGKFRRVCAYIDACSPLHGRRHFVKIHLETVRRFSIFDLPRFF